MASMAKAAAVGLFFALTRVESAALDKIMRSEGSIEVDRGSEGALNELERLVEEVKKSRAHPVVNGACRIPMWKVGDTVCSEEGDSKTVDPEGNITWLMGHQGTCTVKCPLEKWYQASAVAEMECHHGIWWYRPTTDGDPEEVIEINCTTSSFVYCMTAIAVLLLIGWIVVKEPCKRRSDNHKHEGPATAHAGGEAPPSSPPAAATSSPPPPPAAEASATTTPPAAAPTS
mmetsp:Transcript_50325/g.106977  ORF Transcript_50325/g.106977 Transcript_50325/m.106977 type:complete len:230 (-) Transcript_50325:240-929(-)|eukprot:CAMPEP_0194751382 /NCGR_PEP_ID=MMETSP0323_2-20130528/5457_1 /TAXON_ID=2866 ORGANISM="Crypthecodinium cohnii, Strain Seligo" /NCGR_SAMPLE_ID=MMETSP0323_2 /ASSEMBLY_ACC=CAM_ASM_000346 /LENGTH=229 /DNA_ID=CAMNT_0039667861 /DNA_START=83 /DNA_END=772 /DNA_ORIENTATION=-